jgi:predicted ester cyclase
MRVLGTVREEGQVAMSEANKDIVRRYQEAYNSKNVDALDDVLDPNWKTNAWPEGIPQSIEAAKEFYRGALQTFPDLHVITLRLVAEGDCVVQRGILRGTFKGELGGLPPNDQVVEAGFISMFRIAGGKIAEHWAYADDMGFFKGLGVDVPEIMLAFPHRSPADDDIDTQGAGATR